MESVRHRIRRFRIDFADDAIVPGQNRMLEQIVIEPPRAATPARRRCHHDPVHIDEARIMGAEPEEIRAVVVRVRIERQHEGVQISDPAGEECLSDEMRQPLGLQPRQLLRIGVIEGEQGFSQRRRRQCIRARDGLNLIVGHVIRPAAQPSISKLGAYCISPFPKGQCSRVQSIKLVNTSSFRAPVRA
jgi:hypothetical protein